MRTVYIADDGTQFDDKYACEWYEFVLRHPHLNEILMYEGHKQVKDILTEYAYHHSNKVVIPTEEALKDFLEYASLCGYCCFEDITEVGTWKFNERKETFVKVK